MVNETQIFSKDFSKNTISNYVTICPVGAQFSHADGQREGQTWRS